METEFETMDDPPEGLLIRHQLQRSQDSGAITDWSSGSGSPTRRSCKSEESFSCLSADVHPSASSSSSYSSASKFVTILSINSGSQQHGSLAGSQQEEQSGLSNYPTQIGVKSQPADFVTVLTVGEDFTDLVKVELRPSSSLNETEEDNECNLLPKFVEEILQVLRLPGEKLGFGLKFDGGLKTGEKVKRLFIQCCSEESPASKICATWGRLVESDEIMAVNHRRVHDMSRADVVRELTNGPIALNLLIRHYHHQMDRDLITSGLAESKPKLTSFSAHDPVNKVITPSRRAPPLPQERAVDVPAEFLTSNYFGSRKSTLAPIFSEEHIYDTVTEELDDERNHENPPVPPPRLRRQRRLSQHSAASAAAVMVSSGDPGLMSFKSVSIPKPPRNKLALATSRSLEGFLPQESSIKYTSSSTSSKAGTVKSPEVKEVEKEITKKPKKNKLLRLFQNMHGNRHTGVSKENVSVIPLQAVEPLPPPRTLLVPPPELLAAVIDHTFDLQQIETDVQEQTAVTSTPKSQRPPTSSAVCRTQSSSSTISVGSSASNLVLPPPPQIYTDLVAEEDALLYALESESDAETGSSVTTVVDRWGNLGTYTGTLTPSSPPYSTSASEFHQEEFDDDAIRIREQDLEGKDFLRELLREHAASLKVTDFQLAPLPIPKPTLPEMELLLDIEPPENFQDADDEPHIHESVESPASDDSGFQSIMVDGYRGALVPAAMAPSGSKESQEVALAATFQENYIAFPFETEVVVNSQNKSELCSLSSDQVNEPREDVEITARSNPQQCTRPASPALPQPSARQKIQSINEAAVITRVPPLAAPRQKALQHLEGSQQPILANLTTTADQPAEPPLTPLLLSPPPPSEHGNEHGNQRVGPLAVVGASADQIEGDLTPDEDTSTQNADADAAPPPAEACATHRHAELDPLEQTREVGTANKPLLSSPVLREATVVPSDLPAVVSQLDEVTLSLQKEAERATVGKNSLVAGKTRIPLPVPAARVTGVLVKQDAGASSAIPAPTARLQFAKMTSPSSRILSSANAELRGRKPAGTLPSNSLPIQSMFFPAPSTSVRAPGHANQVNQVAKTVSCDKNTLHKPFRKSATPAMKAALSEANLLCNLAPSTADKYWDNHMAQRRMLTKSVEAALDHLHVKDGSVTSESRPDNTPIVRQTSTPMNLENGAKTGVALLPASSPSPATLSSSSITVDTVAGASSPPLDRVLSNSRLPKSSSSSRNRTLAATAVSKSRIPTMAKTVSTATRAQSMSSLTLPEHQPVPPQAAAGANNTHTGTDCSLAKLTVQDKKTSSAGRLKCSTKQKFGSSSQLHAIRGQQQPSIPLTRLPVGKTSSSHVKPVAKKSDFGASRTKSLSNLSKQAPKRSVSVPEIAVKSGTEVVNLLYTTLNGSVSVNAASSSTLISGSSTMDVSSPVRNPSVDGSLQSRLPPDGHEFPTAYDEPHSPLSSGKNQQDKAPVPRIRSAAMTSNKKAMNNESNGDNKGIPKHLWRRDERSEKSVRDKIALFTSDDNPKLASSTNTSAKTLGSSKSTTGFEETCSRSVSTLPRNRGIREPVPSPEDDRWASKNLSYSVDNLALSSPPKSNNPKKSSAELRPRPNLKQDGVITATSNNGNGHVNSIYAHSTLNERSRSLMDVSKRHSVGGTTASVPKTSVNNVNLIPRKVSLSALMEQRRQSMSKLRGLVIPDVVEPETTVSTTSGISHSKPILLPEIISKDSVLAQSKIPVPRELRHAQSTPGLYDVTDSPRQKAGSSTVLATPPWKTSTSALPKYSPAFKRKELTVYSGLELVPNSRGGTDATPSERHDSESHDSREESSDTDADSAVSSSRSSFSPSGSPVPDAGDSDSARVLKPHTVEALNRKNVLQSAKFSSGAGSGAPNENNFPNKVPLSVPNATNSNPIFDSGHCSPPVHRSVEIEVKTAVVTEIFDPEDPVLYLAQETEAVPVKEIPVPTPRKSPPAPAPLSVKVLEEPVMETRFKPTSTKNRIETTPAPDKTEKKDGVMVGPKKFRAIAERWEQRSHDLPPANATITTTTNPQTPPLPTQQPPPIPSRKTDVGMLLEDTRNMLHFESSDSELSHSGSREMLDITSKASQQPDVKPRRSLAVHEIRQSFERAEQLLSSGREEETMGTTETAISPPRLGNRKDLEVTPHAIFNTSLQSQPQHINQARLSSLESTTSDESSLQFAHSFGFMAGMSSGGALRDNFGSITSLASSTSLISPQELQQLLEEANQSLEESGTPSHEIVVVVLHRGEGSFGASSASLGLGITLAGGADYETKEITVHKVISGSLADRDGRIKKGDRVLSINGKSLKGVTHREALTILKTPRPEVVLVLSRSRSVTPQSQEPLEDMATCGSNVGSSQINVKVSPSLVSSRPPRILESPMDSQSLASDGIEEDGARGPVITTSLSKDGAGLGFSLEGGKDSPLGDRPLTVKKIFTGGAASKNGVLRVGDQILSVNGIDVTCMSRIEAWNLMKKLPDGSVSLRIRQLLESS